MAMSEIAGGDLLKAFVHSIDVDGVWVDRSTAQNCLNEYLGCDFHVQHPDAEIVCKNLNPILTKALSKNVNPWEAIVESFPYQKYLLDESSDSYSCQLIALALVRLKYPLSQGFFLRNINWFLNADLL